MNKSKIIKLIISITLPLAVGGVAGIFTVDAIVGWYKTLNQPSFNPPNWVFSPVWTALYLLMGISFYQIWNSEPTKMRNQAILIFMLQLIINFGWSFLFFYFHLIGMALLDIILMWTLILVMIIQFHKVRPFAAYLNFPYLCWVSFATALNASYYFLN